MATFRGIISLKKLPSMMRASNNEGMRQERSLLEEFKGESFAIVGVNSDPKETHKELVTHLTI